MKTLVHGAGPLGSFCAAKLYETGVDVSLLAHNQRKAELEENGVVLEYVKSGRREVHHVPVIEEIGVNDLYELIIVTAPKYIFTKDEMNTLLVELSKNKSAHTVLFTNFNVAGFNSQVEALGAERVMAGYLVSTTIDREPDGGVERDQTILVMPNSSLKSPIGEIDGSITDRTRKVKALLKQMDGQPIEIRSDMEAWMIGHMISTITYLGLYAANLDIERYLRTRGAMQIGIRARTEVIRAQKAAEIPISPSIFNILPLFPEPVAIALLRLVVQTDFFKTGVLGICRVARNEFVYLLDEYRKRIAKSGVPTPAFDMLTEFVEGTREPLPDGCRNFGSGLQLAEFA